jgi:rhodanese-related sulfurtransferase
MQSISVEELKAKIDSGEKFNLIDVREPNEHTDFNVGGILLPLGQVQMMQLDDIESMKDEPVYVYCRSGNRSGQACLIMEAAGFKNTINVTGGMLAWHDRIGK